MRNSLILVAAVLTGCSMSMDATRFYAEFPMATGTSYYSGAEAIVAVSNGDCLVLSTGRFYAAPIGMTLTEDLRNGADGVDLIVANDGGNAYRIDSYVWAPFPDGSTQLQLTFDTMLCKPADAIQESAQPVHTDTI